MYSLNHTKNLAQVGRGRACLKVGLQINQYSVAKRNAIFLHRRRQFTLRLTIRAFERMAGDQAPVV